MNNKPHSEETKIKLSNKLKVIAKEKGFGKWMLGKKLSVETKRKISENNAKFWLGKKRPLFSEETRKKMSNTRKGGKLSEKHIKNISLGLKGKPQLWHKGNKYALGYKHSEEAKGKISEAQSREKSHCWAGGISFEPYSMDWTKTLRRAIRERDYYTCQICKEPQGDRALSVHHIDYDKKNCDPKNLVALCVGCHTKTNFNRSYWTNYFNT